MYQSETSLEPLFKPDDYCSSDAFDRDCRLVLHDSWHLVGVASSVPKSGDYFSADVIGIPVIVRNFDGALVALRNVCAHRQCQLVTEDQGHSDKLKCLYHGWEYGADGKTRKIPASTNFPLFDREQYRLDQFAVAQCGDLVFVRPGEQGPTLQDWMGELYDLFNERFSLPNYKLAVATQLDNPANWKIPVEASLESYHIPQVHPMTFGEDPGESRSEQFFREQSSSFHAALMTPRMIDRLLRVWECTLLGFFGIKSNGQYEHHHIYPNLLVSFTDSLSLAHFVKPTGPTSAVGCVWTFGRQPERTGFLRQTFASLWGRFTGHLSVQVLKEDVVMYPKIQSGLASANRPAILGRCEERLHSFQQYVNQHLTQCDSSSQSEQNPAPMCADATGHAEPCRDDGENQ
jgi:choline monooxygenase